ncbi:MAG: hypothetical protein IKS63_00595, partial [Firmicutes bacterium]|nr:hypothetical protein [Bacillota bacterium]
MIYAACTAAVIAAVIAIICLIQIIALKKASDTTALEEMVDRQMNETGQKIYDTEQKVLGADKRVRETGENLQKEIKESRQETLNFM